jgi:hypothetical protein
MYVGQPGTTATTIYNAPPYTSNQQNPYATAVIKEIWLVNTSASNATITIGINGVAVLNQFIPTKTIAPNDSVLLSSLNLGLSATDTLQALQGTSGAITVIVSGIEVQ